MWLMDPDIHCDLLWFYAVTIFAWDRFYFWPLNKTGGRGGGVFCFALFILLLISK